ncbi:unnamed protein product [Acanthoscelides obtectus]|uniref:G-protein coupled receptors family 2 profile 2 domain-containing protein n=1 Tax=Acanthoscelides obtectus TaxID=200917 RepID=A0A9P0LXF3_ACAOB|nr:unnamed protein product [Acanthoscelides obtectus]CAK1675464.1 G-protein coupled receptor Mth2 [Acanthoscelides obtectus]
MVGKPNKASEALLLEILLALIFKHFGKTERALNLCSKNTTTYDMYTTPNLTKCGCGAGICVRKCCQHGFYHPYDEFPTGGITEAFCQRNNSYSGHAFSIPIFNFTDLVYYADTFSIGMLTCNENEPQRYFKMNNSNPEETYLIQSNGSLYFLSRNLFYAPDRFCVDEQDGMSVYLCYTIDATNFYNLSGMIISMPFLLLTFLVYLIIPEKNLHRKALMFYVICLLLAYVLLVTSNLSKYSFPDVTCHLIGYFIMFFFLGSFLWMNVMCIDMWLTFSGARGYGGTRSTEQKRFLFYCLYAVGVPAMFILFVFLLNTYGDEESIFHPKLGRNKCFLEDGYPQLFYLYLPMATLIGMNIILFILTAIKIQRVKMETAMLKQTDSRKHNYEGDKQQFNLYLKLLFAMGVNWTTEVISWAALWKMQSVPSWIWYLTDLINALYGIFIFFIFVFKKKIWQSLKKRLLWKSSNCTLSSGVSTPHVSDIKLT